MDWDDYGFGRWRGGGGGDYDDEGGGDAGNDDHGHGEDDEGCCDVGDGDDVLVLLLVSQLPHMLNVCLVLEMVFFLARHLLHPYNGIFRELRAKFGKFLLKFWHACISQVGHLKTHNFQAFLMDFRLLGGDQQKGWMQICKKQNAFLQSKVNGWNEADHILSPRDQDFTIEDIINWVYFVFPGHGW